MKKIIPLFLIFISSLAFQAQFDTTNCTVEIIDTIKYTINKSNTPVAISINTINESVSAQTDDGYSAFGQLFEAPDTVNLNGFCFYGFMYSGTADSLLASIFLTNSSGELDSLIDSTWVQVPLSAGYNGVLYTDSIKICVDLDTTYQITSDYVITLANNSSSDMYIVRNSNGTQEDLAYSYYTWTSNSIYDGWFKGYSSFGASWDFDIIIEPIISYFINAQHLTSTNSNCLGDTLSVSSSLNYNDSLLYHRMYNPNFSTYNPTSNFVYSYGDTTTSDTSHVYGSSGSYNALFIGATNMSGWTFNNYNSVCSYYATAWDFVIDLGADTSICADSINLSGGQYFDAYLWNTTDTSDILTIYADSLANGIYQYSLETDFQGCYSYDTIQITIGELPINLGNDTTICLNQQLDLYTNSSGQHYWNSGQLTESITVGPFNEPDSLVYMVEVESSGCLGMDTINVTIDNCLGLDNKEETFSIYPNPAKDFITIDSKTLNNFTISIIDINGRTILNKDVNGAFNKIDLSNLDNGTYIIQLSTINENIKHFLQIIK